MKLFLCLMFVLADPPAANEKCQKSYAELTQCVDRVCAEVHKTQSLHGPSTAWERCWANAVKNDCRAEAERVKACEHASNK